MREKELGGCSYDTGNRCFYEVSSGSKENIKNTAVSYETDLRKMKEFLYSEGVLSVEDVRQEHLKIYMEKQEQEGKKPATISRGLASMKAFFSILWYRIM